MIKQLNELVKLYKHLLGEHDQRDHTPKAYASSSGAGGGRFSEEEGWSYDKWGNRWSKQAGNLKAIVSEPKPQQLRDNYDVMLYKDGVQYLPTRTDKAELFDNESDAKGLADMFLGWDQKDDDFVDYYAWMHEYMGDLKRKQE